jgi:signal transduction histidine kinase
MATSARHGPGTDDAPVTLASIDIRAELESRPCALRDFEQEDRALAMLGAELAEDPKGMLQRLVETALDLCRADTAGGTFLETRDGTEVFRFEALAGVYAAARDRVLARNIGPCGTCIDQNMTQLMYLPDRFFPALRHDPRFVEILLIPFVVRGRPVGTVWIAAHNFDRKFDCEDERRLRKLGAFVSGAWQIWRATAALQELNTALKAEIEERKRAEEHLRHVQKQLKDLPALLVQAQENERRLLARELHDDISQKLAALAMTVSVPQRPSEPARSPDRRIRDFGKQIGLIADDVHRMSRHLHPAILDDLGLETALREECTAFSRRVGIPVRFRAEDVPRFLPADTSLCLFRVAQESLRNAATHACAKEINVSLMRHETDLALFIEDMGDGFNVKKARGKRGLGLISMEERVRLVNGTFKIRSLKGVGTVIEVHVPLSDEGS